MLSSIGRSRPSVSPSSNANANPEDTHSSSLAAVYAFISAQPQTGASVQPQGGLEPQTQFRVSQAIRSQPQGQAVVQPYPCEITPAGDPSDFLDPRINMLLRGAGITVKHDGSLKLRSGATLNGVAATGPDGKPISPDETGTITFKEDKVKLLSDGTLVLSDGKVVMPGGVTVSEESDGVRKLGDGRSVLPDSTVVFSNGDAVTPDGEIFYPNGQGRTILPNGWLRLERGSLIFPAPSVEADSLNFIKDYGLISQSDGSLELEAGKGRIAKDGTVLDSNGNRLLPDETGTVTLPNDRIKVLTDGSVVLADGQVITLDKKVLMPDKNGITQVGDTRVLLDSTVICPDGRVIDSFGVMQKREPHTGVTSLNSGVGDIVTKDGTIIKEGGTAITKDGRVYRPDPKLGLTSIPNEGDYLNGSGTFITIDGKVVRFGVDHTSADQGQSLVPKVINPNANGVTQISENLKRLPDGTYILTTANGAIRTLKPAVNEDAAN